MEQLLTLISGRSMTDWNLREEFMLYHQGWISHHNHQRSLIYLLRLWHVDQWNNFPLFLRKINFQIQIGYFTLTSKVSLLQMGRKLCENSIRIILLSDVLHILKQIVTAIALTIQILFTDPTRWEGNQNQDMKED